MMRILTIAVLAIVAPALAGPVAAQAVKQDQPARPAGKQPPAQQKAPAQQQAPAQSPSGEFPQLPKPLLDLATGTFLDEHPICVAYFSMVASCLKDTNPEQARMLEMGRVIMTRTLGYEKERNLPTGTMQRRADEALVAMRGKIWECTTLNLVLGDLSIPCRVLAEDPEARMRAHLLEAADKLGREGPPGAQQPAAQQPAAKQ
jgi:hypothetical protein